MNRDKAIETFGVSYNAVPVSPERPRTQQEGRLYRGISDYKIVEVLGTEGRHATIEEAEAHARDTVGRHIEERLDEIAEWEGQARTKMKIAAARVGLRRDAEGYLERVRNIRKAAKKLKELQETGIDIETERLPQDIKMPHRLEAGQTVYKVEAYYLNQVMDVGAPPITAHTITDVALRSNSFGRTGYDYTFTYTLDDGKSFSYDRDAPTDEPISSGVVNYNYFLNENAARAHMRDIAQRITARMEPYL